MVRPLISFTILLALSGCAQFETGRSFLSEMEHDDSTFYTPDEDFPVMAGDTGKFGRELEDYTPRTPQSEDDRYRRQSEMTLKQELRDLESKQNENNLNFYQKHKSKLSTVSDRIYFLKLPSGERSDYLASRGFLEPTKTTSEHGRMPASLFGVRSSDLNLGMTKTDVMNSWGQPARVEVAGNPSFENERWAYSVQGATKYIYFESGTVQGWE